MEERDYCKFCEGGQRWKKGMLRAGKERKEGRKRVTKEEEEGSGVRRKE